MAQPLRGIYINSGLIAGFVATVVISLLMIGIEALRVLPQFDMIGILADLLGRGRAAGWTLHFMIGTVGWGVLFAGLQPSLPGRTVLQRGVVFGILAWLVMMLAMPLAGADLFALNFGWPVAATTFILHVIFAAVLGLVYAALPLPGAAGQVEDGRRR